MNRKIRLSAAALCLWLLGGCGGKDIGGHYRGDVRGEWTIYRIDKSSESKFETAGGSTLFIAQEGQSARIDLSTSKVFDDCILSATLDGGGAGKITGARGCELPVPGQGGSVSLAEGDFVVTELGLRLEARSRPGPNGTVYRFVFEGRPQT